MMMSFIDFHRKDLVIKPISRELAIAPSSSHGHAATLRQRGPVNCVHRLRFGSIVEPSRRTMAG
jgi:hypothetical protein